MISSCTLLGLLLTSLTAGNAFGHGGTHPEATIARVTWADWNWAPFILLNLLLLSVLYGVGWIRLRRARTGPLQIPTSRAVSFYIGILSAFLALISPIDAFSDVLGWVHMIQHLLLMMVAAPLMVFGSPGYVILWAISQRMWKKVWSRRRGVSHILKGIRFSRPLLIWTLYALILWILHIPSLYEGALGNELLHDLQHLAFFGSSFLFWRVTFDPYFRQKLVPGVGILYLFITSLHAMILGVLMALSPRVWYGWYERTAPLYGFTALEDQQIAGYTMWMPAGITFIVVAIYLLRGLLREEARTC